MLAVADTGIGIDEGDLHRIFEPFYSTKTHDGKTGKDGPSGSGLGLSVSAGIVKDLDGWIECERRSKGGTIFRVFLPAPERDDPTDSPSAVAHRLARTADQPLVPSEGNSFEEAHPTC
jgi:signal transduction histidine kinase